MNSKNCGKCGKVVPDDGGYVTCFSCLSVYCYGSCSVKQSTYKAMSEAKKKNWKCESCREEINSQSSQYEPDETKISMTGLKQLIDNGQKQLLSEMQKLNMKIENLIKLNEEKDMKIKVLEKRVLELEQETYSNDIEIIGIKQKENENLVNIVEKISKTIGVTLKKEDINDVYRIKNNREQKGIIVRLQRKDKKQEIMKNKNKLILSSEITGDGTSKIKIFERISKHTKKILWETRNKAKENGWKFVWTNEGRVLARKEEGSKIIEVVNENDIKRL